MNRMIKMDQIIVIFFIIIAIVIGKLSSVVVYSFMTGSVIQNIDKMDEAIYSVGMNNECGINVQENEVLKPVRISVFPYKVGDDYVDAISKHLKEIQVENEGKVQFTFYDSKNDQGIQNKNILNAIKEGTDVLLVNLVNIEAAQQVINEIKENNLPVILYNREPPTTIPIKSYNKALYIGTDAEQAGILQGKDIIDVWNSKKDIIDRNDDGIMQYIMLMGERNNIEAIERTKYSIETIEKSGIKTEEIALRVADWNEELAKKATEALFFRYGDRIEVIIANDDNMAIGAIDALQAQGYNNGDETKTIPVFGVNATAKARELIEKGFMAGTVLQDSEAKARALYEVAMNMASKKYPLEGTSYKFDETGVSIRIPYREYKPGNSQ